MKKKYLLCLLALAGSVVSGAQTLGKARELFRQGKYAEAIPTFQKLVKQSPSNANYNYWYGACCMETGRDSLAMPYLEKAVKRKVLDAYPYLIELQMNRYRYDDAVETGETYVELLSARKRDTAEAEATLARARAASLMLKGTERVCVVDSFVVDKADFLSAYRIDPESGTLTGRDSTATYENELGLRRYLSVARNARTTLYSSDKLLDEWTAPRPLDGLPDDGNNNYPYMLADGTTLYFANDGSQSLGGYDIFVTRLNTETGRFLKPENLGMPYNSPANDYMMVIDEYNNLGWFASDRYQPEGKVCVYVFVPNEARRTFDYEQDGDSLVIARARLDNIRSTWDEPDVAAAALARLEAVVGAQVSANVQHDFKFVVDDARTYYRWDDFRSPEAQRLYRQYLHMRQELSALGDKLDGLRARYASAPENDKARLSPEILDLESRLEQKSGELEALEIKARNTEIAHTNR